MQLSKLWHLGEDDGEGLPDEGDVLGESLGLVLAREPGVDPGLPLGFPEGWAPPDDLALPGVLAGCGFLPDSPALPGLAPEAPVAGAGADGWTTPRDAGRATWAPPEPPWCPPLLTSSTLVTPPTASSRTPDAMARFRRLAAFCPTISRVTGPCAGG
jgi:hypothetical protein